MSDLHLEAVRYPNAFRPRAPAFDVLVVAGDVLQGDSDRAIRLVAALAGGRPAVFVLGNHEFWHREIRDERVQARRSAEREGVHLLDDSVATVAGVRFVGGTLWGDGTLAGTEAAPGGPRFGCMATSTTRSTWSGREAPASSATRPGRGSPTPGSGRIL